ncbi:MAG: helix-hairpin-helix domain-containing protein [Bacteroides sp.]|nr:helix-hairpin-helix domain-containing protein [Bacteroides sp.]
MSTRCLIMLFVCIFFTMNTNAQNVSSTSWNEVIEQLAISAEDQDIDLSSEIEELSEQISEPLNLNTVTKDQLERFPFLTDIQIENILAYLYINGPMKTIYELQLIENLDKQTIQYLLPFVYVDIVKEKDPIPTLNNILKYAKNEVVTRFDIPFYQRKGYETVYLGPSLYHSLRYSFRYRDQLYAGITAEKDAGEPFAALHNRKGYNYYSFYFYLRNIGWLKALTLGNYRLSFGHGLVISNDFTMGKTSSLSTINFRNNTIKKHSSSDEYNYFRGIATAIQWNRVVLSEFYSHRSFDGTVSDTSISSINKTGLHRTEKEADRRGSLTQQLAGGNITYQKNNFKIGATGIY